MHSLVRGFRATRWWLMSKKLTQAATSVPTAPNPPDGQAQEWWQRLKNVFGTASSAFVDAFLHQLMLRPGCRNAEFPRDRSER